MIEGKAVFLQANRQRHILPKRQPCQRLARFLRQHIPMPPLFFDAFPRGFGKLFHRKKKI
jgi:hypothetical protein